MTDHQPRTGAGPTRLAELRGQLSNRDWAILTFLRRHRYSTTTHLRDVFFHEHATTSAGTRACVRVVHRLMRDRLIARLERRVGGTARGSAASIWYLDAAGERLTRPKNGVRRRYGLTARVFLDHTLAVVDTHVALITLARSGDQALERVEIEIEAWRSYLTRHGATSILKPDLYAHLSTADYDDHWYIEVDRGTESVPVLLEKCRAYAAYWATGHAQGEHGVFPRVLWILPTQRRVAALLAAIRTDSALDGRLFLPITPDQLTATLQNPDTAIAPEGDPL